MQLRPRNEALDCLVYALAALRLSGLNLEQRAKIHKAAAELPAPAPVRTSSIQGRRARFYVQKG